MMAAPLPRPASLKWEQIHEDALKRSGVMVVKEQFGFLNHRKFRCKTVYKKKHKAVTQV